MMMYCNDYTIIMPGNCIIYIVNVLLTITLQYIVDKLWCVATTATTKSSCLVPGRGAAARQRAGARWLRARS